MPISPTGSLVNIVAGLPVQGPAAQGPASPAAKAAEAALAARQTKQQAQNQALTVPTMTAEAHRSVANLPRGSFLNIVV
jgi:hypothetical protein